MTATITVTTTMKISPTTIGGADAIAAAMTMTAMKNVMMTRMTMTKEMGAI